MIDAKRLCLAFFIYRCIIYTMRIEFDRIELHNFMVFEDEVFDFNACHGMSIVQGKNNDVPGSKNGVGKS